MSKKTENVIYINDEKHEIDKFDVQQRFLCSQIQNLQQRHSQLSADLDVVNRALQSVSNDLIKSLQNPDEILAS